MEYTFKITVSESGDASEDEVKEYIEWLSGARGSISEHNPFIDEDLGAEIIDVEIDTML